MNIFTVIGSSHLEKRILKSCIIHCIEKISFLVQVLRERNSPGQTCFKGSNRPKEMNKLPSSHNSI